MPQARTTIKDIARRCGVHASTVSRVLNPQTRTMVSAELAERILAVAERLGYRRNPFASSLRTRRSLTVGVLIPDLTNPVFPPIVRGVERTLSAAGYTAILADSANDQRNEEAILESLQGRRVDGLILATAHRKDPVVDACLERDIPLVLVNRSVDDATVSAVVNDDERGIRLALEHLIGLGHRDIAYVGGPQNTSTGYARHRAFRKVARALGLDYEKTLVVNARTFDEPAGAEALGAIFERGAPFTAVVAANDLLALGCYDALAARGLTCPDDISVTGFNDMPFVDRCHPPLTTVHIQHDELGATAARLLLERILEPERAARLVMLPPRLMIRGSTRSLGARAGLARRAALVRGSSG